VKREAAVEHFAQLRHVQARDGIGRGAHDQPERPFFDPLDLEVWLLGKLAQHGLHRGDLLRRGDRWVSIEVQYVGHARDVASRLLGRFGCYRGMCHV